MQTPQEIGKYVTDGKLVYPYNAFLDELVKNGTLQYCDKPTNVEVSPRPTFRSPINYTPEERLDLAQKLGITLGELTNMSGPEFEEALTQIENGTVVKPVPPTTEEGFPA
jgi:hypothetical protein